MFKRILSISAILVATGLTFFACKQQPTSPPPPPVLFELEGTVFHETEHDSLLAISGAAIVVTSNNIEIAHDTTDADGVYSIDSLPNVGSYTVTASHAGFQTTSVQFQSDLSKEERLVDIMMHDTSDGGHHGNDSCCNTLHVLVRDSSGHAITGAGIEVQGTTWGHCTSDANGSCTFEHMCAGQYIIIVNKGGYQGRSGSAFDSSEVTISGDSCRTYYDEVHLYGNGSNTHCCGRVTLIVGDSATGCQALSGAHVTLSGQGVSKTGTTNDQGKYMADGLCNGQYYFTISKDGYKQRSVSFSLTGDSCPSVTVTACLGKSSNDTGHGTCCNTLNVTAHDSAGGPNIAGATIQLIQNNNVVATGTTNGDGIYTFHNVCNGTFYIKGMKDGYNYGYTTLSYTDSCEAKGANVFLSKKSGDSMCCSGRYYAMVRDSATNDQLKGVTVRIYVNNSLMQTATTDDSGYVWFLQLCSGKTYNISFNKDAYHEEARHITIDAHCNTINQEIWMRKN